MRPQCLLAAAFLLCALCSMPFCVELSYTDGVARVSVGGLRVKVATKARKRKKTKPGAVMAAVRTLSVLLSRIEIRRIRVDAEFGISHDAALTALLPGAVRALLLAAAAPICADTGIELRCAFGRDVMRADFACIVCLSLWNIIYTAIHYIKEAHKCTR